MVRVSNHNHKRQSPVFLHSSVKQASFTLAQIPFFEATKDDQSEEISNTILKMKSIFIYIQPSQSTSTNYQ